MPIGYLGYAKLANQILLTNSTGLNRTVNPIMSTAVWGAGWYNAATTTNYADGQQFFEGGLDFELQAAAEVWNLIRDWLIEDRACSQSLVMSPDGFTTYSYTQSDSDARSGVWLRGASINISPEALITLGLDCIALQRTEAVTTGRFCADRRTGTGMPLNPLNPAPLNRNPIPGWMAGATVVWPNAPAFWSNPAQLTGMVLRSATINVNNNTQLIKGCTGDRYPVAVIQGTIDATGDMSLWREGGIPDPYEPSGNFTASNASVEFALGGAPALQFYLNNILLTTDAYNVKGQNEPTSRDFGFAGLGDGVNPPLIMDSL